MNYATKFLSTDEIITDILKKLRPIDREKLMSADRENLIESHHTDGQGIRNQYKLWDENNPNVGNMHPDDLSMEIIKRVWDVVVGPQRREAVLATRAKEEATQKE